MTSSTTSSMTPSTPAGGPPTSTPHHHVSDEQLLENAAGMATEAARLAFACHIALCRSCAARTATLEALGGSILAAEDGSDLSAGALDAVLARLDAAPESRAEAAAAAVDAPPFLKEFGLPLPLLRRLAAPGINRKWRLVVPGVRAVDLPTAVRESTVRLIAFKGGVTIPLHDHGGAEYIVVFSGALAEAGKRFVRGDISVRTPGERHEQHIEPGAACIALVVNEGALRPLTLHGRILLALARGG